MDVDSGGFSAQMTDTIKFELGKGRHLIQFSLESRIEPKVIASYWDTVD